MVNIMDSGQPVSLKPIALKPIAAVSFLKILILPWNFFLFRMYTTFCTRYRHCITMLTEV